MLKPQTVAVPFRQFVLKVHSRCDLACDHCYMYEAADQSWRTRPLALSRETAALIAERVAEHADKHDVDSVRFVLHGGEPLLVGATHMRALIETLRKGLDGVVELDLRLHTNGVLLDRQFCDLFAQYDVAVGISLDGDKAANDRHRRYANGRSSHERVLDALALLRMPEYRRLYAGILCTIDIANDPIAVYEALRAQDPPQIDLLLPHATWDVPPTRPADRVTGLPSPTAYADWLIRIHDQWVSDGKPFGIRIFDSVRSTLHGGPPLTESLGVAPSDLLVFETDGSIEQVDSLKIAFDGAPDTGLSVFTNALDDAAKHPGIQARQAGVEGLSAQCRACPVVESCGGGLYAHRYRSGSGFDNPSVYCSDLLHLINHLARVETVPPPVPGPCHAITLRSLRELADGFGDAEAIAELAQAQHSVNRLLVAEAAGLAVKFSKYARAAWDTLVSLDKEAPAALKTALAHPYVRAWAARVLGGDTEQPVAGHLASIAASAAWRAGIDAELDVPVRAGAVNLPGLGRFMPDLVTEPVRVRTGLGSLTFSADQQRWRVQTDPAHGSSTSAEPRWQPTDTLRSDGIAVQLEDTDPERDCHHWPATARLDGPGRTAWHQRFDAAWRLIIRDHPAYAPALAQGLSSLTPLTPPANGSEVSAAARQAFGAIGAALPQRAAQLALLLVHEFQHVKLGAVLDMYDLYDETDRRLYYAPWRDDPRPLEGLLQGTYAHIAVTDFWRVRRMLDEGEDAETAEIEFARWRVQTARAIDTLVESSSLTPLGLDFAEGMRATLTPWLKEDVSAAAEAAALSRQASHEAAARPVASG
jgi:uncharacterized protein